MVQELLDAGEDSTVIDNLSTGFRSAVPEQVRFVEGNAGDMSLVGQLLRDTPIDAILHFAGSIVVPESVTDPLGYCANNTCNSRNLLACAVDAGVPNLIFSSTAAVYSQPDRFPAVDEAPLRPISPYRSSKLRTETMLAETARAYALCYVALLCSLALFQRRGCGSARPDRTVDPSGHASNQGRMRGGFGPSSRARHIRNRLSDIRRHLRALLHPSHRFGPGSS